MNLVVLGEDIDTGVLKALAKHTGARGIEQIHLGAFRILGATTREGVAPLCDEADIDYAFVPEGRRLDDFGLFVTDMDSTLINIECIDVITSYSIHYTKLYEWW